MTSKSVLYIVKVSEIRVLPKADCAEFYDAVTRERAIPYRTVTAPEKPRFKHSEVASSSSVRSMSSDISTGQNSRIISEAQKAPRFDRNF